MTVDGGRERPSWARLGSVDPWVWLMVIPVLLSSLLFFFGGVPLVGGLVVVFCALAVLFDAWCNRPGLLTSPARKQGRPAVPQRRPAASRPPEAAPSERRQPAGRSAEPPRQAPGRPSRGAPPGRRR